MIDLLKIVVWILVNLFKLLRWIFKTVNKGVKEAQEKSKQVQSKTNKKLNAGRKAPKNKAPNFEVIKQRFLLVNERASSLRESIRRDRACERIAPMLERHAKKAIELTHSVSSSSFRQLLFQVQWMERAQSTMETMVSQRQEEEGRETLGDADAFALACYQPLIDFARAENVPLRSAEPVAMLGKLALSTWTGFATTGLAPLFLPPSFFQQIAWWPAVAHEIAHDVLVATIGADSHLRAQLDLPDVKNGRIPLGVLSEDITVGELRRVVGGWFEEIFCDVFGTLMLGPAYVITMVHLFASPDEPELVTQVGVDETGKQYVVHPPRHLRVLLCCDLLDRMGHHTEAVELEEEWEASHGYPAGISFPVPGFSVEIPVEPLREILEEICTRLAEEPLQAFGGYNLAAIPGVDYGPHRHQESLRSCDELLRGKAPKGHKPRAVIAGAVLAWNKEPEREQEILLRARHAIRGASEWIDHYDMEEASSSVVGNGEPSPREAFILHTIFAPPLALSHKAKRGRMTPIAPRR